MTAMLEDRFADIRARLNAYRDARADIDDAVVEASRASMPQKDIAAEAGLSREGIRKILVRRSTEEGYGEYTEKLWPDIDFHYGAITKMDLDAEEKFELKGYLRDVELIAESAGTPVDVRGSSDEGTDSLVILMSNEEIRAVQEWGRSLHLHSKMPDHIKTCRSCKNALRIYQQRLVEVAFELRRRNYDKSWPIRDGDGEISNPRRLK